LIFRVLLGFTINFNSPNDKGPSGKAGVKIIDHHSASKQFMQFMRQEAKEGRDVTADWSWIVPPSAGSTMKVFHTEMQNSVLSPNYFYQENPWD